MTQEKKYSANEWIDYDMIISEIMFHRRNAQRRVSEYKKMENPSELDTRQYEESVGMEVVLMTLQAWCNDFKFSSEEVREIIDTHVDSEHIPIDKEFVDEMYKKWVSKRNNK